MNISLHFSLSYSPPPAYSVQPVYLLHPPRCPTRSTAPLRRLPKHHLFMGRSVLSIKDSPPTSPPPGTDSPEKDKTKKGTRADRMSGEYRVVTRGDALKSRVSPQASRMPHSALPSAAYGNPRPLPKPGSHRLVQQPKGVVGPHQRDGDALEQSEDSMARKAGSQEPAGQSVCVCVCVCVCVVMGICAHMSGDHTCMCTCVWS